MPATNPHEESATGNSQGLPARPGPRPRTTPWAPHIQEDQNAPADMQAMLAQRVFALPEVEEPGRSAISTPGTAACTSSWTPSSPGQRSPQDGP